MRVSFKEFCLASDRKINTTLYNIENMKSCWLILKWWRNIITQEIKLTFQVFKGAFTPWMNIKARKTLLGGTLHEKLPQSTLSSGVHLVSKNPLWIAIARSCNYFPTKKWVFQHLRNKNQVLERNKLDLLRCGFLFLSNRSEKQNDKIIKKFNSQNIYTIRNPKLVLQSTALLVNILIFHCKPKPSF